jgi:hypothetical protein
MKTLTQSDINAWCVEHGLVTAAKDWPMYEGMDRFTFLVKLPKSAYQTVALARWCFPFDQDGPFSGGMVWFKEWGIWDYVDEETGMSLLQKFRASAGERRALKEAPGHLFQESEFADARACWSLPVIFGWDAFLFPSGSEYFVFNSHDEVLSIVSRNLATHETLLNQFKDWEIEKGDWYFHGL